MGYGILGAVRSRRPVVYIRETAAPVAGSAPAAPAVTQKKSPVFMVPVHPASTVVGVRVVDFDSTGCTVDIWTITPDEMPVYLRVGKHDSRTDGVSARKWASELLGEYTKDDKANETNGYYDPETGELVNAGVKYRVTEYGECPRKAKRGWNR